MGTGPDDVWRGLDRIQAHSTFHTFWSPIYGIRAAAKLVRKHARDRNLTTIRQIIHVWAPASDDNAPDSYAATVAKRVGVGPDDPVDFQVPDVLAPILWAMSCVECGLEPPYPETAWVDGVRLAMIT